MYKTASENINIKYKIVDITVKIRDENQILTLH